MPDEKKTRSLFDDDITHDVRTVHTLWQYERRRRRLLMARIFIPLFVLLVSGGLIVCKALRIFPFRDMSAYTEMMEAREEAAAASEAVRQAGAYEVTGFAKADFKITFVSPLEDSGGHAKECEEFLLLVCDGNPSTLFLECWKVDKLPEETQALFDGGRYGVLINGKHTFTLTDEDGKTAEAETIRKNGEALDLELLGKVLNDQFKKSGGEKDVVDIKAYRQYVEEMKADRAKAEAAGPSLPPKGDSGNDKDVSHTLIRRNFNLDEVARPATSE